MPGWHAIQGRISTRMKTTIYYYILSGLLILGFIVPTGGIHAQLASAPTLSVFNALTQDEGAKMTIETDLTTIISNKKTNQYFPGTLTTADGKSYKIELRPRGKYRRKVAEIPPLKIKFSKKGLRAEGLDTLNEIKLVLPCYDSDKGDELIIREYLAYKMFEKISPVSIRARLIRLTLRDTHVEKSKKTMFAILVEDQEETCARLNGVPVEDYGIPTDSLHTHQAALLSVFEYMIGNTDWEVAMIRNVRLVRAPGPGKIIPLPYDFDFSGLVSAPYATPSSESGLKTVRDRFMMAPGIKPEALKKATQTIKNNRRDLMAICDSKFLNNESIAELQNYLNTYFQLISDKDDVPQSWRMPATD
jgi:hypothetical protein